MALNPDPRPGRWLLPLVILAMVSFTYIFVQNLPGDPVDAAEPDSTTTTTTEPEDGEDGENGDDGTGTTEPDTGVDTEVQLYVDTVDDLENQLLEFQTEMAAVNGQWDNDEIEFADAVDQMEDLAARIATWAESVTAIAPPATLTDAHAVIDQAATAAADTADDVVAGLRAPDTGEARRAALTEFDGAITAFTAGVDDIQTQAAAASA